MIMKQKQQSEKDAKFTQFLGWYKGDLDHMLGEFRSKFPHTTVPINAGMVRIPVKSGTLIYDFSNESNSRVDLELDHSKAKII